MRKIILLIPILLISISSFSAYGTISRQIFTEAYTENQFSDSEYAGRMTKYDVAHVCIDVITNGLDILNGVSAMGQVLFDNVYPWHWPIEYTITEDSHDYPNHFFNVTVPFLCDVYCNYAIETRWYVPDGIGIYINATVSW